jgi:hypothetical protein
MRPRDLLIVLLALAAWVQAGEKPVLIKETLAPVAAPSFAEPLDSSWSVAHGTWTPEKGELTAVELPADKHVAVLHHNVPLQTAVFECEFRSEGPFAFYIGCDGNNAHIGRVVVNGNGMVIAEDSVKPSHVISKLERKVKPGDWHSLRVEWRGAEMAARLDGKELTATHPYLEKAKSRSWLAVSGTVLVRRLSIQGIPDQP